MFCRLRALSSHGRLQGGHQIYHLRLGFWCLGRLGRLLALPLRLDDHLQRVRVVVGDSGDQSCMPSYPPGTKVDRARIALRAE